MPKDYETGKIKNLDELYTGTTAIKGTDKLISQLNKEEVVTPGDLEIQPGRGNHFYMINGKRNSSAYFLQRADRSFRKSKRRSGV